MPENGPYNYYVKPHSQPRLVEISGIFAYFTDDPDPVRVDKLTGVFVRLVETGLPITRGEGNKG